MSIESTQVYGNSETLLQALSFRLSLFKEFQISQPKLMKKNKKVLLSYWAWQQGKLINFA
jgi:hypothetical protein